MNCSLLTEEHAQLAERAREAFSSLEPGPRYEGDAALAAKVKALRYYGHLVPSAYGGALDRVDVRSLCVLREELAYRNAAADSVFAVQGLGSHPILLGGDEQQKKTLLPRVA